MGKIKNVHTVENRYKSIILASMKKRNEYIEGVPIDLLRRFFFPSNCDNFSLFSIHNNRILNIPYVSVVFNLYCSNVSTVLSLVNKNEPKQPVNNICSSKKFSNSREPIDSTYLFVILFYYQGIRQAKAVCLIGEMARSAVNIFFFLIIPKITLKYSLR